MKSIPYLITVAALIFAFVMWDRYRDTELLTELKLNQAKTDFKDAVESRDSTERAADARIQVLRDERRADSTKQAERTKSFHKRFNDQMSQIARLKEKRISAGIKIDTTTRRIETEYDSTIQAQAEEISALHVDLETQRVSFQTEIDAVTEKLEAEREVSSKALAMIDGLEIELKREKKRGRVFKYLALGLAGWLIFNEIRD